MEEFSITTKKDLKNLLLGIGVALTVTGLFLLIRGILLSEFYIEPMIAFSIPAIIFLSLGFLLIMLPLRSRITIKNNFLISRSLLKTQKLPIPEIWEATNVKKQLTRKGEVFTSVDVKMTDNSTTRLKLTFYSYEDSKKLISFLKHLKK